MSKAVDFSETRMAATRIDEHTEGLMHVDATDGLLMLNNAPVAYIVSQKYLPTFRRVSAAWNACQGTLTATLEASSAEGIAALAIKIHTEIITRERDALIDALHDVLEFVEDQEDVIDGSYGEPRPNRAMHIATTLRDLLAKHSKVPV